MIRYDVDIRLAELDPGSAREAVEAHHRRQPYTGDFFMGSRQLNGRHLAIDVDGQRVGVAAASDDGLSLCTIGGSATRYSRQIVEAVLAATGTTQAYAASWDRHHVDLFGNFASGIDNQAYQFELLSADHLRNPVPGLALTRAGESDLDYLGSTGFLDDYAAMAAREELRVARMEGAEVGIGVVAPQPLDNGRVDIGTFTQPDARRAGIGRSILALAAREVLAAGRMPTAGCWWRNQESRRTFEAAGLTCIGTIFRFDLDPDRFEGDSAPDRRQGSARRAQRLRSSA